MAYQVYFQALSFQKTKAGEPTIPDGDPVIVMRGENVPAWVPEWHLSALSNSGMIVPVADNTPRLEPADAIPALPRTPDQPAVLPHNPNSVPEAPADVVPGEDADNGDALPPLPRDADKKEVWESYAQRPLIGMTEAEAEGMNKTDLVAEVKRRHAVSAQPVAFE